MEQVFNLSSGHILFIQDSSESTFDYEIYSKPSLIDVDGGLYDDEELDPFGPITIDVARTVLKEACRGCPKLTSSIQPETVQIEVATDIDCDEVREVSYRNMKAAKVLLDFQENRISFQTFTSSITKLFNKDPERFMPWLAEKYNNQTKS